MIVVITLTEEIVSNCYVFSLMCMYVGTALLAYDLRKEVTRLSTEVCEFSFLCFYSNISKCY